MRVYARRGELNGKPVFHLKDAIEYLATPKPKAPEPEIEVDEDTGEVLEHAPKQQPQKQVQP